MPFAATVRDALGLPQPRTSEESLVDAATLLPTRADLFLRLDELAAAGRSPVSLVLLGLLRKDDGWPTPGSTLGEVTSLIARSLRGDDWLARSGTGEFALVLNGSADSAETAAFRLAASVAQTGIAGLAAAAGIATLEPGVSAGEMHRRANLCLTAARSVGAGAVIRYRGTR
ncbi:diguanylate cyclase domain-containing protein [Modestobacter sp. URMC 112]